MNKTILEIIDEMQSAILILGGFMTESLDPKDTRVEQLHEHVRNWAGLQEKALTGVTELEAEIKRLRQDRQWPATVSDENQKLRTELADRCLITEDLHRQLAALEQALQIANRSADDQMFQKRGWERIADELAEHIKTPETTMFCKESALENYTAAKGDIVQTATTGSELIAEERERQIAKEGWTPAHDDTHADGEMGMAALSYILAADYRGQNPEEPLTYWPWDRSYFKPVADPVRNLVKAGALIAAEIDRRQRL